MHSFKDKKSLPYKAEFINEIILDIEKYPEFLPWCSNGVIISKSKNEIVADLTIDFKAFSETYRSLIVTNETEERFTINVESISGSFKTLKTVWAIKKGNNNCQIDFSIDFEFKSAILDVVVGAFFSIAVDKMVNAFETRANDLSRNTASE